MFVITADQIGSRTEEELAGEAREGLNERHGSSLLLPADRNAGDEVQALTDDAASALAICLELTRTGHFSVGLGVGPVRTPLPQATREASGPAFFAARDAVDRAKRSSVRFAISRQSRADAGAEPAADAEAIIALLLILRERRSAAGWELYELIRDGLTQAEAAKRLGITAAAASARARAANIRAELAVSPALTRLLDETDRAIEAEARTA